MEREERLRSRRWYKAVLILLKIMPMLLALLDIANTAVGFLGIECHWLTYFGGVSFLTLAFLYLTSYVFGFCRYHRMFLHYILLTNVISIADFEFCIPVTNLSLLGIHSMLLGSLLFLVLYFYRTERCCIV